MNMLKIGTWNMLILGLVSILLIGCSNGGGNPVTPDTGSDPHTENAPPDFEKQAHSGSYGILGTGVLIFNEEDMTIEVVPNRTADIHLDVTWIQQWCPACLSFFIKNWDPNTRIFNIEMHTMNPANKIVYDVRFIVELDDSGTYDMMDPDNFTKLFNPAGIPSPFRAIAKQTKNRAFYPAANYVEFFDLYLAKNPTPIQYVLECSFPARCMEPYMISDIEITGEFPPGGGGEVTVDLVVHDSQDDHGEIWLRTGGIFTAPGADILMIPGSTVGEHGISYSTTFQNTFGGGSGLTPVLIEAYTEDIVAEPMPLNDYARIFADPGGDSAIAGEVFNALTKQPINGSVVNITNTSGGGNPLPIDTSDGTYFATVVPGTYNVQAIQGSYFAQDTLYDAVVPADTVVYICFGLAPKYLDDPDEALASISGHIRSNQGGEPIVGAQATLDGGPQTGGVIQARVTDTQGHYCFYAIPTFQQSNWTVHAYHPDYLPEDLNDIQSQKDKSTPQVDFDLTPLTADAVWRETFEAGPSNVGTQHDWTFQSCFSMNWPGDGTTSYHNTPRNSDILWRVHDPISDPVQNIFYTNGICLLPPDDLSDGYLPDPYEGHQFLWYGEELDTSDVTHSGSFIDEWDGSSWAGGSSSNGYNAGWAKTGPIDLSAYSELTLALQSWWEIEGVDPSIQYDALDILISTDDLHWNRLDRLNPLAEPIPDSGNAAKAYTSAGFHQAAIWSPSVIDISSYGGNPEVWLRFDFDTRDPFYNGFRSWIIDDIVIWPYTIE